MTDENGKQLTVDRLAPILKNQFEACGYNWKVMAENMLKNLNISNK